MSTLNNVERVRASVLLSLFSSGNSYSIIYFVTLYEKLQNLISKTRSNFLKAFQRCAFILNTLNIEASAFKVEQKI